MKEPSNEDASALGGPSAQESVAIKVLSRAHSITATIEIPAEGAEGVIVSHGNEGGGYALFVQDGRAHYVHNYSGALELHISSTETVPTGRVRVRVEFQPMPQSTTESRTRSGSAQLYFDDRRVASKHFPVVVPLSVGASSSLSIGKSVGTAVSRMYTAPFRFTGKIISVRYDLSDRMLRELETARR